MLFAPEPGSVSLGGRRGTDRLIPIVMPVSGPYTEEKAQQVPFRAED